MGFFSDWFGDKTGIEYFKDFGYNQLHTTTDFDEFEKMYCVNFTVPRSNDERYNAVNSIYNNLFGKDVGTKQVSHLYNKYSGYNDNGFRPSFSPEDRKIGDPGAIAYVDVNITQDMADYLNKELAGDNPLRAKINTDSNSKLSTDEIQNYFDKFAVKGYSIPHYNNNPANPSFSFSQSEDTGKISHFDIENIYALKNNAIIQDALFTKYNGDGSFNTNAQLSYDDIKDKSIISESDFRKLDAVSHDYLEKGFIDKGVFDRFEFDKNGDHVIDKDEYAEGMQRVDECLKERVEAIDKAFGKSPEQPLGSKVVNDGQSYDMETKQCNNGESEEHIAQQSSNAPDDIH